MWLYIVMVDGIWKFVRGLFVKFLEFVWLVFFWLGGVIIEIGVLFISLRFWLVFNGSLFWLFFLYEVIGDFVCNLRGVLFVKLFVEGMCVFGENFVKWLGNSVGWENDDEWDILDKFKIVFEGFL